MSATASIRVHPDTRDALRRLSGRRGQTIPEVVRELATSAEENQLLSDFAADCERIQRADPQTWGRRAEHELLGADARRRPERGSLASTRRMNAVPLQREVWFAELDPVRGSEQAGRRPVLHDYRGDYRAERPDEGDHETPADLPDLILGGGEVATKPSSPLGQAVDCPPRLLGEAVDRLGERRHLLRQRPKGSGEIVEALVGPSSACHAPNDTAGPGMGREGLVPTAIRAGGTTIRARPASRPSRR